MNEIPQSLRNMIDARWREERMNALSIWFIVALFQFLLRHFAFASVSAQPFVAILLPLGWLFPLLAVIHWFRWRSFQSDLKGGTVLVKGRIEKFDLNQSEGFPPDETLQHISIIVPELNVMGGKHMAIGSGYLERHLQIPLTCWRNLPNDKVGECEYLPNAKIVWRINGQNVWPKLTD